MKQKIIFVIDKKLDIENHLIGLRSYQKKLHSYTQNTIERNERLLKLPETERKKEIAKEINFYYQPKKRSFLNSLTTDINATWAKKEKIFIKRLEKIHKNKFPYKMVRGVLSTAGSFGYSGRKENPWFAVPMFKNKFAATDTAMHENMHFMFHNYYWNYCLKKGLSEKQTWNIKEAFTVLLNLEFADLRFEQDSGYPEHKELREVIKKTWLATKDFNKTLDEAIKSIR